MYLNLRRMGIGLLVLLVLLIPVAARADFGNFAGDTDYDFSQDSNYDASWSSGYDNDWGGGYAASWSEDSSDANGINAGALVLGLIAFIIVLYFIFRKPGATGADEIPPVSAQPQLVPISAYTHIDLRFSAAALSEKLANLYVRMQQAWQERNIEELRPYFTDALYSQMDRQLEELRRKGWTNYIERIAVLKVELQGYYQSGQDDHIVARVYTRIVDYTLEDKTGQLVSGDRGRERFMTYEWDLVRPTGTFSSEENTMTHVSCPNCGAPLSVNESARCAYCGTVVTLKQHDWVIFAIKGIAQVTK